MFGEVSRTLDARLKPIEIATCGTLVFGRFPAPHATQTLADYLGEGFPVITALSRWRSTPEMFSMPIQANWRLCLHITLDDYHIEAVHPDTFGRAGYLKRQELTYIDFGLHSAYLQTDKTNAWQDYIAACRDGSLVASHYTIMQVMPNLNFSHAHTDGPFYSCVLQQAVPLAHDRVLLRAWIYPAPFDGEHSWYTRVTRPFTEPVRKHFVTRAVRRIFREDAQVCERLQAMAHQIDNSPRLGALEERIAWFEASYRRLMVPTV
jgi:phenylpropionate dioxygenase-like ring-hydroxylating dioxygenase large terminal subunit